MHKGHESSHLLQLLQFHPQAGHRQEKNQIKQIYIVRTVFRHVLPAGSRRIPQKIQHSLRIVQTQPHLPKSRRIHQDIPSLFGEK